MNKRKILSLALGLCMVAILAVGGTLAYFVDTDSDTNTMTIGNLSITQNEWQRGENGTIEAFENNKPMNPAVYDELAYDQGAIKMPQGNYDAMDAENVVDKIVNVTNNSTTNAAYIRTIFAFEHTAGTGNGEGGIAWKVHTVYNGKDGTWEVFPGDELDYITLGDGIYSIAVYTYKDEVGTGKTTAPSLLQVFFDKETTNEDLAAVGSEYTIKVLSQAVQSEGFDDAAAALNEGFGEVTAANVKTWFNAQ